MLVENQGLRQDINAETGCKFTLRVDSNGIGVRVLPLTFGDLLKRIKRPQPQNILGKLNAQAGQLRPLLATSSAPASPKIDGKALPMPGGKRDPGISRVR